MGGQINIGWKKADGTFEVMCVWTNAILEVFHNPEFLKGNIWPLERHFAHYRDNSPAEVGYGPSNPIPSEYGFILVDEENHKILDWQGYTSIQGANPFEFGFEREHPLEKELARRKTLLPFVNGARYLTSEGWEDMDITLPFSEEQYASMVETLESVKKGWLTTVTEFKLDFPGWEVVELQENSAADFLTMKNAIADSTSLSDDDKKAWAGYEKRRFKKHEIEAAMNAMEKPNPGTGWSMP